LIVSYYTLHSVLKLFLISNIISLPEGRTFGKIRRLQMALIPIIFKFGVLSAMVAFLVAIGMKSLFLLKVLVVMNAIAILGKFITLKTSLFGQYENTAPSFNYPGWNPHAKESWGTTGFSGHGGGHPPSKEIHLHIHGNAQTQAQLAGLRLLRHRGKTFVFVFPHMKSPQEIQINFLA